MKKGMIVEIRDGEHSYEYPKMNWMKYKDGNLIISYQDENDEERIETGSAPDEIIFHPYHVEVQVSEEEWRKIQKEAEFHCGFEESGGHAYNCNDCPNKCEEWYQWDKEFKEKGE